MTREARIALAAALVLAAVLWGAVTGVRTVAWLAIALVLGSVPRGELSSLSAPVQGLLLLASGLGALFLTALFPFSPQEAWGDRELHRAWSVIGSGSLLFAALRTHIHQPEGGVVVTVGLGLIGFVACGSVLSGPLFGGAAVVYLPLMFMAVRLADPDRARWRDVGWRHQTAMAGLAAATALGANLLLAAIPAIYEGASRWALRQLDDEFQVGFHDGPVALGSLQRMLDSDEIVMRVEGELGARLRGNAYSNYANAFWLPNEGVEAKLDVLADRVDRVGETADARSGVSAVAIIRHAGEENDRFFLPLDAAEIELSPSRVEIDSYGIARPADDEAPAQARLRLGPVRRLPPAAPGPEDSRLPDALRPKLEAIAAGWTQEAETPEEVVRVLQTRLEADYVYSLEFSRRARPVGAAQQGSADSDAILQFLEDDRQGHCEYFATALVLLARASGSPARLVTGYRVIERNELGGYYIVRERHAHAWAEVHLGETGWVAFDPSPIQSHEGATAATTPLGAALWDWFLVELREHGSTFLLVLLAVAFGGIQLRRLWVARRRGGARPRAFSATPLFVSELLRHLRKRGWPRSDDETLEAFARRLRVAAIASPSPCHGPEALLVRAAALRYGEEGDSRTLERDVRDWIKHA